ncbi:MAG: orc1/cdc6 family replication initiation protein [Phycisphaeraceae bacterium]|nr:orc1/cdc6 family replication initiation protein [Phycisphaeraceae bacterium]
MKIDDYLDQQTRRLSQARRRIKNFQVFHFNHIPDAPLMRQEIQPITDACLRFLYTGIPSHLFIFGARGSGKTLSVRYVTELIQRRETATVRYVNARHHNTSFKIISHLLDVRPRGYSLDELWHHFCDRHTGPTILIIDEVDLLNDKDRSKELLYLISRSSQPYMAILLSNNPRFLNTLDGSIRSTLQPELIHFRNYDAGQIHEILRQRSRDGLTPRAQPPDADLARIAALTTKTTNSDVRIAIKALYYLAIGEGNSVQAVFDRARRDLVTDVLRDLHDHNMLTLLAAIRTRECFVKEVYRCYQALSRRNHEEPFSYTYFLSNLYYLQSIGLVGLSSTKVGRSYTNRIALLFDPQLAESTWASRIG